MTIADDPILLPDPEPAHLRYTIISVDDHLVEPPDMFEGRLPAPAPGPGAEGRDQRAGHQVWEFEGELLTQVGMNAVAGRGQEREELEPFRFEPDAPRLLRHRTRGSATWTSTASGRR